MVYELKFWHIPAFIVVGFIFACGLISIYESVELNHAHPKGRLLGNETITIGDSYCSITHYEYVSEANCEVQIN